MLSKENLKLRQQAIDAGETTYTRVNGSVYAIRNLNNPKHQRRYQGQGGRDELFSSRKANRGGLGDQRAQNEKLATPTGANKKAYGQAIADASSKGKEAHHNRPIARTAEGIRFVESTGRSTRENVQEAYSKTGQPLGNQAGNMMPLYTQKHQQVHAQYDAMDQAIARAGQAADTIFKSIQSAVAFNAAAVFAKLNGNGNGNGNGKKNGNGKPNGKPNGKSFNLAPAVSRGLIKSSPTIAGSISFAFEPVTTTVNSGLDGPHIFIP